MFSFERVYRIFIKEMIQIFRDPRMKFILFVAPIVQVLLFGYAATTDVKNITTAIYDLDQSKDSRKLISQFLNNGYFELAGYLSEEKQVQEILDQGEARLVIRINKGFGENLRAGRTAQVQLLLDGTDSNTAGIILNYANSIVERFNEKQLVTRFERMRGTFSSGGGVQLQIRTWFNENLSSQNYYVPAVIALIVMVITLVLSSMAVVREKEIGTIEQIMVSPIRQEEFILGKTLPFVLIGFADVALISLVAVFYFKVPIQGNIFLLFFSSGLFLMSTLGVGLLISTISRSQQQAMMTSFFFNFPAVLLSGFMFPIANMPMGIQWLTYLNPLHYYLVAVRGIFLKGIGISILWPELLALFLLGSTLLWLAAKRFNKTLT